MNEKQRKKILLGILGVAISGGLLKPTFDNAFVEPVAKQERAEKAAQAKLDHAQEEQIRMMVAQKQMSDWKDASLPPNPLRAQDVYKNWVRNLAIQSGFVDLTVEPGRSKSKQGVYDSVPVTVDATANLKQLRTFLYRFYKTNLTHRIVRLTIKNDDNESELADMEVNIGMEGLCVAGAAPRSELFPTSKVVGDVGEDANRIVVASAKEFPTEPGFVCSVDNEFVRVTEVNGNEFKVERGVDGTPVTDHPADAKIELYPVNPTHADIQIGEDGRFVAVADTDAARAVATQYNDLVEASMFTKPRPPIQYKPRLASIGDRTISRGSEFKTTARLSGTDPSQGKAVFQLAEGAPKGMQIDKETGAVVWITDEKVEPGKYEAKVFAWQQQNPDKKLDEDFVVTIEIPNDKPQLSIIDKKEAYIGGSLAIKATATDDGDAQDLTFTLENAPAGAAINPSTGELTWDLPADMSPGNFEVKVVVTDAGDLKDTKTVTLTALDDVAKFTNVTSFWDVGKPEIWLRNKLTGKEYKIYEGDSFEVADIKAEVVKINGDQTLLRTSKGLWNIAVGQNLRSMVLVEAAEPEEKAATEPSEASKSYEDDSDKAVEKDTSPVDAPPQLTPTSDQS